jgi:hypothetical protein
VTRKRAAGAPVTRVKAATSPAPAEGTRAGDAPWAVRGGMHAARCTARCPLHAARRSRHEARDDPRRRGLSGVAQPPCLFHGTKQSPSPRPLTAPAPARSAVHRQPSTPQNNNLRGPLPVACRRSASAVPVDFLFCFCCFCTSGCAGCTHDVARRAPLCPARQCQHTCARPFLLALGRLEPF